MLGIQRRRRRDRRDEQASREPSEDLPCPWCLAPTHEADVRCPSCGQRFG